MALFSLGQQTKQAIRTEILHSSLGVNLIAALCMKAANDVYITISSTINTLILVGWFYATIEQINM